MLRSISIIIWFIGFNIEHTQAFSTNPNLQEGGGGGEMLGNIT